MFFELLQQKPCRILQVSDRNTLENAHKVTSTSKFSTQNVQIPYHLHPALSYSLSHPVFVQEHFKRFQTNLTFYHPFVQTVA